LNNVSSITKVPRSLRQTAVSPATYTGKDPTEEIIERLVIAVPAASQ